MKLELGMGRRAQRMTDKSEYWNTMVSIVGLARAIAEAYR